MARTQAEKVIEMRGIVKRFYEGTPNEIEILHGIDLDVYKGEFLSVIGQSGSGKSTLMNIMGALDKPTAGSYVLDGTDMSAVQDKEVSKIRNQKIGFVFQNFNLIGRSNAEKNVELPLVYAGLPHSAREKRARELLGLVGMADREKHLPNELSGGQKQRVAIARALACKPSVILADEPTGALDSETGRMVMDLFHQLNRDYGTTIVLITHNEALARETDRVITLADGRIVKEERLC